MAIEDGYQLSLTLDEAVHSVQPGARVDIEGALRKYQSVSSVLEARAHAFAPFPRQESACIVTFKAAAAWWSSALLVSSLRAAEGGAVVAPVLTEVVRVQQRLVRASSIHGLAGMAAIMASTYKAYMGEGLGDFGKWLMKFKIPHFGKVRQCLPPATCTCVQSMRKGLPTAVAAAATTLRPLKHWHCSING
jgi:hypothetical protein